MFFELILFVTIICYAFYRWATAYNDFFEKRGIPYDKPFPLFGSMKDAVLRKKSFFNLVNDLYKQSNAKVYGIFDQRKPLLMIRDPELVKQLSVKDFDHFVNHRSVFGESDTDLFVNSLFLLKDGKWKDMRSTLSPVFTGSKMRNMFELMVQVAENASLYLKDLEKNVNGLEIDVKDFVTRFTNDIIASTVFGLQVNSYKDKDKHFFETGKRLTQFTAWQNLKFFLYGNFKSIMKFFKLELFDKDTTDYFMRLVLDTMKYRKENNITRPDMINMLMEARGMIKTDHPKPHSREWTDVDIVAQCFLFFFAGFETVSTLMCFAAHELMENPDVQQRLYEEIEDVVRELNGKPINYEKLQNMKYLDMVISETLRKWPGAVATDRVANKDYVLTTNDGDKIEIKEGQGIWFPICGIQRDPKYFPNPDKFDPERFSDENKDNILPYTYFPFGSGPRICIGNRFALLESKAMIFYLVKEFHIEASKKSCIPIELSARNFQMIPTNGFWLKFTSRSK